MDSNKHLEERSWRAVIVVNLLAIIVVSTILGFGVAQSFPWFQWVKQKLGVSSEDLDTLTTMVYDNAPMTRKQTILRNIAKALNCHPCCSFWTCLVIVPIFDLQSWWWWWLPCAIASHCCTCLIESLRK